MNYYHHHHRYLSCGMNCQHHRYLSRGMNWQHHRYLSRGMNWQHHRYLSRGTRCSDHRTWRGLWFQRRFVTMTGCPYGRESFARQPHRLLRAQVLARASGTSPPGPHRCRA
ncbi:MAG: hypothetical protein ABSG36_15165 [Acidimicrobiales bacterium]